MSHKSILLLFVKFSHHFHHVEWFDLLWCWRVFRVSSALYFLNWVAFSLDLWTAIFISLFDWGYFVRIVVTVVGNQLLFFQFLSFLFKLTLLLTETQELFLHPSFPLLLSFPVQIMIALFVILFLFFGVLFPFLAEQFIAEFLENLLVLAGPSELVGLESKI